MTPTIEPYRMVEPQTMSDAELRAICQLQHPTLLQAAFEVALRTLLLYTVIFAILIIW